MFGNQYVEQARRSFSDQFEPDGSDYLYRRYLKGAPIRVSAAERDRYIEAYSRYLRYSYWAMFGGSILVGLAFVAYAVETNDVSQMAIYIGLGLLVFLFVGANFWARDLPTRELRGRGAVGEARSPAEVKRLMFAKITYGQLAGAVIATLFMLYRISLRNNLLEGWNRLWLALAGGLIVFTAIQAFRKWRFESSGKQSPSA